MRDGLPQMDDLIHLDNDELIGAIMKVQNIANREYAHEIGDQVMVILLLRAADNDLESRHAVQAVAAYQALDKLYG